MILLLKRYVSRIAFISTLAVTGIVAVILLLLSLLGELKAIGQGEYGLFQAILYVLLRLPNELYQFLPALTLLGSMMALSLLAMHRELIVMQISGFSSAKIAFTLLGTALIFIIATSILGEWVAPDLSYHAEVNRENARHGNQAVVTASGIWFHVDDNFIHVNQMIGNSLLEGVTRYRFDKYQHLLTAYFAKKLILVEGEWWMEDVVETDFFKNGTKSYSHERIKWDLPWNNHLVSMSLTDPSQMSLRKLSKYIAYLEQNSLQASQYQYVFWQRLFQPLAAWIMVFIALPFALGSFRNLSLTLKTALAILVGFAFFILNAFLGQLCVVFQLPAIASASFPLILFSLGAIVLFMKSLN